MTMVIKNRLWLWILFVVVISGTFAGNVLGWQEASTAPKSAPPAKSPPHATFAHVVRAHFAQWDLNHNGQFEAKELNHLLQSPGIHGESAAALATIKSHERRALKAKVTDYSATEEDLAQGIDHGPVHEIDSAREDAKPFKFETEFEKKLKGVAKINHKLFAHDKPIFSTMRQGSIGDCFFFSVVGNLAAHQPERITRMISTDKNGGYQVHFGDGVNVAVTKPTEAEILVNNSTYSVEDGTWLTVLEKAVGHRMHEKAAPYQQTDDETDAISFGGSARAIISMFTGHQTDRIWLRTAEHETRRLNDLRQRLPTALAAHQLVTVSMGKTPPTNHKKIPQLGYWHVYAVFGFDPKTDHITLWNPWGNDFKPKESSGTVHGFETKHGVFHVPLKTLYEQFSSISFETERKLEPIKHSPK